MGKKILKFLMALGMCAETMVVLYLGSKFLEASVGASIACMFCGTFLVLYYTRGEE